MLLFILVMPIILAQASGYFMTELNIKTPISQLYKLLVLLFFILYCLTGSHQSIRQRNIVILILTLITYFAYFLLTEPHSVVRNIQFIIELFLFPFSYYFFSKYYRSYDISISKFQKVNRGLLVLIGLFILLSIFGFGASHYGETQSGEKVGYSGYFNAVNELNSIILLLLPFSILNYKDDKIKIHWYYFSFGLIICLLIGSKTLLLGFILICIFSFILNIIYFRRVKKVLTTFVTLGPLVVASIILTVIILFDKIRPLFDRMVYKYHSKNDFWSFITSSRVDRVEPVSNWVSKDISVLDSVFGFGYFEYTTTNISILKYGLIEMDIFDVVFIAGLIGLFIIYFFWFKVITLNTNRLIKRRHPIYIGFSTIVILLFITSLIAGHVMYSSLSGIYIGFSMAYSNSKLRVL